MQMKSKTLAVIGAVVGAWLGTVAWDYAQNQTPAAAAAGARAGKSGARGTAAGGDVVATIDGTPITRDELDQDLIVRLNQLEDEMFDARQEHLEALIGSRLLAAEAKRRGVTVDALVKQEVDGKTSKVTDEEISQFYQANRAQIREDEASAKPRVRAYLEEQRRDERREAFVGSLRKTAAVDVKLERPAMRRAAIDTTGAPAKGPAAAKVTIVEFSDFHCPYCRGVQSTLSELLSKYGDRVRLVFRHFPVDSLHPQARRASEAAWCAQQQDKFWQYHDRLYLVGNDATPGTLSRIATDVGLDAAKFSACTASGAASAAVEKDIEDARRLSLNGTPTFFINGRPFIGRQPIENFTRVIDEELAHAQ
jgi:protein-disulfide isomerase